MYPTDAAKAHAMTNQGPMTAPSTRDTIQQALDEQEKTAVRVHEALSELENRLHVVLGPSMPSPATTVRPTDPPPSVTVLARVRGTTYVLSEACRRIADVMGRLEL